MHCGRVRKERSMALQGSNFYIPLLGNAFYKGGTRRGLEPHPSPACAARLITNSNTLDVIGSDPLPFPVAMCARPRVLC
ncbi:hypothetical protein M413DRAFT_159410 [Hebeloma cylindrosporum]|uniref:Uncharacterized protein n=1 Tax=Hebeloma cylindrosporum TaxID=76867 RepID=A0A0C3CC01_HEBCY|nr:hypothetical protein M413DRAFT_159410 [Hebeloma cylindrosporum h7]